jgi:ADP-glucose pyrophosphorylase
MNSDIYRMFVLTQFNSALNAHKKNTYNFSVFSHAFVDILAAEQTPIQLGFKEHPMQCANVCLTFES